jgi:hypothetical protein
MKYRVAFALTLPVLVATPATAVEPAWTLRTIPEWHQARDDSPFSPALPLTDFGRDLARQELEMRAGLGRLDLIATARSTAQRGFHPDNEFVVNQAAVDATVAEQHFGFGKKIFSWDVGFGFRPLDLIQQENRRAVFPSTLEGVPYLSWEHFNADSSWLLLYANPGRGRSADAFNEESLAIKVYARWGSTDLHAVARISRRFGIEAGPAFSDVVGESIEVHGSVLYQQRYERQINRLAESGVLLSPGDPIETRQFHHGGKALLGMTWSTPAGTSILGEAWYDASAYSTREWRAAADLARRQATLRGATGIPYAAVIGNIAYGTRYFDHANLLRANMLLRASHHGENSDWEPAIDLLYTPADGGYVVTTALSYARDRYRVDSGIRCYGGPTQSAYRLLPEQRVAYLGLRFAF